MTPEELRTLIESDPQALQLAQAGAADALNAKTVYSDFVTPNNKSTG